MLSADNAIAGVLLATHNSFDAVYGEMTDLITSDPLFDNYVPGFVITEIVNDEPVTTSPTLEQALEIWRFRITSAPQKGNSCELRPATI